jgi:hypothetical protein
MISLVANGLRLDLGGGIVPVMTPALRRVWSSTMSRIQHAEEYEPLLMLFSLGFRTPSSSLYHLVRHPLYDQRLLKLILRYAIPPHLSLRGLYIFFQLLRFVFPKLASDPLPL